MFIYISFFEKVLYGSMFLFDCKSGCLCCDSVLYYFRTTMQRLLLYINPTHGVIIYGFNRRPTYAIDPSHQLRFPPASQEWEWEWEYEAHDYEVDEH